jgi:hypothetical protein
MRESKPHGFVAWLFDCCAFSILCGSIVAIITVVYGNSFFNEQDLFAHIVFGSTVYGASLVYHLFIAKRTHRLTPGERIAGRFLREGTKVWLNPYSFSRKLIFVFMLVTIIHAANFYDDVLYGFLVRDTGAAVRWLGWKVLIPLVVLLSCVQVGVGKLRALKMVSAIWLLFAANVWFWAPEHFAALVNPTSETEAQALGSLVNWTRTIGVGFSGFLGLCGYLMFLVYTWVEDTAKKQLNGDS